MRCYYVNRRADGAITQQVVDRPENELPEGNTRVRVQWSSLNYKDALAATGHSGVARSLPHVPGIDAAGVVEASTSPDLPPGTPVIVTSYGLGSERWGGWSEQICVPSEWVIPLPGNLTAREAMILGTAGITAGIGLEKLQLHGIVPGCGPVLVTGATGGVGILALRMLAQQNYEVVAVSGKRAQWDRLRRFGAHQVLDRAELVHANNRPLLPARWAGAIDTVGGTTLGTILRELRPGGCVAACGLVGGTELTTTVYPFLLRGITLAGIDSGAYPRERRLALWQRLANTWKPDCLEDVAIETDLDHLHGQVQAILAGEIAGRVVVRLTA
ncbi:MAG: acryloyl-CoA reductase [Planctomycetes bacterium]|nr:acryloyl-CoA reductase [Planctomycetota bacterium]